MTLDELQPHVDAALATLEWAIARARWKQGLLDEVKALTRALDFVGSFGIEEEPIRDRLAQIEVEQRGDVTADCVPQHPVRSVPMDLITAAVVRRVLGIPSDIPVLSVKVPPSEAAIADAIAAIAQRWHRPNGAVVEVEPQTVS